MIAKMRKLFAVITAAAIMLVLTGCNSNTKKYEQLKKDIVGMWCDINGPEYFENEGNPYYKLYEFTSAGEIIYHTPMASGSFYTEDTYELRDAILVVGEGGMCRVNIENDVLTMTYNEGASQYRRMSIEEVSNFGCYYIDDALYEQQLDYLGMLYGTDDQGNNLSPNYQGEAAPETENILTDGTEASE